MENIKDIKYLIAKDKLAEAMEKILSKVEVKRDSFNDAILLSLDLSVLKKEEIKGIQDWRETIRFKKDIANRMLAFLDSLN